MLNCGCNQGSAVTLTETPTSYIWVIDGVPTVIPKVVDVQVTNFTYTAGTRVLSITESNGNVNNVVVPLATTTDAGLVELATAADYPSITNNVDAATPAYVQAAIAALPAEVEVTNFTYVTATRRLTITESNGDTHFVTVPLATTTEPGLVELATSADYPSPTNNVDAATPAYVKAAIDDLVAGLPAEVEVTGFSYTPSLKRLRITESNGDIYDVVLPDDVTTPLAGIAALTDANRGLSLGEVDIPTSRALTIAEMTQTNADLMGVSFEDMQALYTNKAAEPAAFGMMNSNGILGHYSRNHSGNTFASNQLSLDNAVVQSNGAIVGMIITPGETYTMPAPSYQGQILKIRAGSTVAVAEAILDFSATGATGVGGTYRDVNHVIRPGGVGDLNLIIRNGEEITLVALSNTVWYVENHNYRLFYGAVWREHTDGKISMWFSFSLASVADVVQAVTVPILCNNLLAARVQITDANGGKAIGDPISGGEASHIAVHCPIASGSQFGVAIRAAANNTPITDFVGFSNFYVEGAVLDYSAYGTGL
jgi:uncharacterized membrane protein